MHLPRLPRLFAVSKAITYCTSNSAEGEVSTDMRRKLQQKLKNFTLGSSRLTTSKTQELLADWRWLWSLSKKSPKVKRLSGRSREETATQMRTGSSLRIKLSRLLNSMVSNEERKRGLNHLKLSKGVNFWLWRQKPIMESLRTNIWILLWKDAKWITIWNIWI